jgi:homocysteine S-methyltransferase
MKLLSPKFFSLLNKADRPILADGAMGTMLHARGVSFDQCFDLLNLTDPALVGEIHQAYIAAGSQIIYTNTFGANHYKLAEHGIADRTAEINRAGVELAKRVVMASYKDILVAGDVGPLGVRLAPFGRVQPEHAQRAFNEQIAALCEVGIDLLVIETFSDLYEIKAALDAAKEFCDLPVVASMTFTRDDRTILGDTPFKVARVLHQAGADVIGANCSGGPAQLWRVLGQMRQAVPEARFIIKPNAGWPEHVGGRVMYSAGPEYFGEYAQNFTAAGVSIIGGCCGTTTEHIASMREALDRAQPASKVEALDIDVVERPMMEVPPEGPTLLAQKLSAGNFVISVEMDPPRGLSAHKLLAYANLLAESGADVINVADSPMARMRMSPWAVCDLVQRKTGLETTLHFPTRGRNLLRVQGDLLAAHALGIRNVFVVMGDPTSIGDYPDAMDDYDLVPSGLMKLIKGRFNLGIDHAGADIGQPTTFYVGCALNLLPANPQRELKVFRRKIEAGADFALTQPVYQSERAFSFVEEYEREYGPLEIPLLVGMLPLYSSRHVSFLHNEVPGIVISEEIRQRMQGAKSAPQEGVDITVELVEQIKTWADGIYLMPPFDRFDMAAEIIERIKS